MAIKNREINDKIKDAEIIYNSVFIVQHKELHRIDAVFKNENDAFNYVCGNNRLIIRQYEIA